MKTAGLACFIEFELSRLRCWMDTKGPCSAEQCGQESRADISRPAGRPPFLLSGVRDVAKYVGSATTKTNYSRVAELQGHM